MGLQILACNRELQEVTHRGTRVHAHTGTDIRLTFQMKAGKNNSFNRLFATFSRIT